MLQKAIIVMMTLLVLNPVFAQVYEISEEELTELENIITEQETLLDEQETELQKLKEQLETSETELLNQITELQNQLRTSKEQLENSETELLNLVENLEKQLAEALTELDKSEIERLKQEVYLTESENEVQRTQIEFESYVDDQRKNRWIERGGWVLGGLVSHLVRSVIQ